jgi:hypothetical protein
LGFFLQKLVNFLDLIFDFLANLFALSDLDFLFLKIVSLDGRCFADTKELSGALGSEIAQVE